MPAGILTILLIFVILVFVIVRRARRPQRSPEEVMQEQLARGLPAEAPPDKPSRPGLITAELKYRLLLMLVGGLAWIAIIVYWRFTPGFATDILPVAGAMVVIGLVEAVANALLSRRR